MEPSQKARPVLNIVIWIFQILLALVFLSAGFLKAFKPIAEIGTQIFWAPRMPEGLVRFIGVSELLGGIGLILPAALKVLPQLTTFAAAGLSLVMLLANLYHIGQGEFFVLPSTGALLFFLLFVTFGRWKLSPIIKAGTQT